MQVAGSNSEGEQVSSCHPPLGMLGLSMGLVGAPSEVGLDRATPGGRHFGEPEMSLLFCSVWAILIAERNVQTEVTEIWMLI